MMNRTMKLLLLSDIFVLTGFGLIQPILAIYINGGGVTGGTMLSAGLASALFLFTKSMVQLPFGHYVDKQPGKTKWLILGTLLMAGVPIIYITANSIYHIYLAEMIYGLGSGLAYPTWLGLWSANLDKGTGELPVVRLLHLYRPWHSSDGSCGRGCGQRGGLLCHLHHGRTALHVGLPGPYLYGAEERDERGESGGEARFRRFGMGFALPGWRPLAWVSRLRLTILNRILN